MKTKRRIIEIDEEKCDGCGLCVTACAEGALRIIDGKARLISEIYCDGLGACLGECPQGAIGMVEREADAFDERAVAELRQPREEMPCACPGSMIRELRPMMKTEGTEEGVGGQPSQLKNWPVQLMLLPVNAPYLAGADVVIAADCVPCAFGEFQRRFVRNRVLIIACPKLDNAAFYVDKLTEMFGKSDIRSVEVPFMEVPCCGGLVRIVETAMKQAGKNIPVTFTKIAVHGQIVS